MSRPARVAVRVLALLAALLTGAGLALLYGRAAPDAQPVRRVETIGASSQGRPLTLVTVGDPDAATRVLMLGCIHGDECGAVPVLDRLLWATPPPGVAYLLVTHPNPDGESAGTRQNGRGVDLNRNFPGWQAGEHGGLYDPGPGPLSEPESAALHALVEARRPTAVLTFHQALNIIDHSGRDSLPYAQAFAATTGVPQQQTTAFPGSFGTWLDTAQPEIVTLTVELPRPVPAALLDRTETAVTQLASSLTR